MLKVLELFGGIGACSKALKRLKIDFEIVDYVEIDKFAVRSFNAINNTSFEPQDICEWDKDIDVDLIMHGSPCQDFSLAGKQAGGDEGSGTRSSLMYETLRIVEKLRPRYVIWENVKNVLSKRHRHNFDSYLERMKELGYSNFYSVMNAKDYGIPQNRERVFTVSIIDKQTENSEFLSVNVKNYEIPSKQPLKLRLKDFLDDNVDEKYYLSEEKIKRICCWKCYEKPFTKVYGKNSITDTLTTKSGTESGSMKVFCDNFLETTNFQDKYFKIKNATKKGYFETCEGDGCYITNIDKKRGTVQKEIIPTIKTSLDVGVVVKE